MPDSALRRRCEHVLEQLPLPDPFDLELFQAELSEQRGRPLRVLPMPTREPGDPSGLWLGTDDLDLVFFDDEARPVHREHIVLHELAHMICDHGGNETHLSGAVAALVPSLSPSVLKTMLGRTRYSEDEEQEAELLATMIGRHARGGLRRSTDVAALQARLRKTLG